MYSTVHHSEQRGRRMLAWALIPPAIFEGRKTKSVSLATQAESANRLRRVGWAEGGAKGGA